MKDSVRDIGPEDLGSNIPVYAVWELTLKCDQACRHCGSRAGRARPDELDTGQILALGQSLVDLGCREVTIVGGEVYLRPDYLRIISGLAELGLRVSLLTGGRQVGVEQIDAMREAGLRQLGVSIDGLEETHQQFRRVPGGWNKALSVLDAAKRAGLQISVNTQVNRINKQDLKDLSSVLQEHDVRHWQVQLTSPMGRAADYPDWMLQPYEILEVVEILAAIQRDAIARAERPKRALDIFLADNLGYYGPHEELLRSRPHGQARYWMGCQAGRYIIGIEADGTIKPCLSMPTASFAAQKITQRSLSEIWAEGASLQSCRTITVDDLWGFCRTCYYAETCLAGCPSTTHATLARRGNNPFCWHRADQLRQQGQRERIVRQQAAGGKAFDHGRFEIIVEPWPKERQA